MRLLWLAAGVLCIGLGVLGAFLPLLPTTPFLLLAAWCFARSSPRLHDWLTTHRRFGPAIDNWRNHGAISRKAKRWAAASMAAAFLAGVAFGAPLWLLVAQAVAIGGAGAFVLTRPDAPDA